MDNLFFFLWICKTWPFISTTHTHRHTRARAHTSKQQLLEAIVHFFAKNNTKKKCWSLLHCVNATEVPNNYHHEFRLGLRDYMWECRNSELVPNCPSFRIPQPSSLSIPKPFLYQNKPLQNADIKLAAMALFPTYDSHASSLSLSFCKSFSKLHRYNLPPLSVIICNLMYDYSSVCIRTLIKAIYKSDGIQGS